MPAASVSLATVLLAFGSTVRAQEDRERSGFWWSVDAGVGQVEVSTSRADASDTPFYLGFTAGYTISSEFLLGIEFSGWLYEAGNLEDPSKGEGLSQALLMMRYYPIDNSDFFVRVGGGAVFYSNNAPGANDSSGWGLSIGGGYDIAAGKRWSLTPSIAYNYADLDDREVNAITLAVGITWH